MTSQRDARPVITRQMRNLPTGFLGEIISELRKVVWPTREEATRLTMLVVVVSVSVGCALAGIDYGFHTFIRWFLK